MPSKYQRKSQTRIPYKKIVIAMEGAKTEPSYFLAVKDKFKSSSLAIIVLEREITDGRSAPKHVIKHLDNYVANNNLLKSDECWIVIDKDRWPEAQIKLVAALCSKHKNYYLALSNPCFEIWLVLHFSDLSELSSSDRKPFSSRDQIKRKWAQIKSAANILSIDQLVVHIENAISNARKLDTSPRSRWPQIMGTHVYRLAESVIKNSGFAH